MDVHGRFAGRRSEDVQHDRVGDPIDTSTLGTHTFTVTATDKAGNVTTLTIHYFVVRPSLRQARTAAVLARLRH